MFGFKAVSNDYKDCEDYTHSRFNKYFKFSFGENICPKTDYNEYYGEYFLNLVHFHY